MTDFAEEPRAKFESDPSNNLTKRILAANIAWQEFIATYHASLLDEPVYQNLVFLLFAKFVLELVNDNHLRTQLFGYFEPQFLAADSEAAEHLFFGRQK